ncbi:MAG: AAA family ATPase [Anaerolineaceae bacterium]|nr:AAA family ATPase [Anaerolineaceae bacterium]
MPNNAESVRILLASTNPSIAAATREDLAEEKYLNLVDREVTPADLFSTISKVQPDVVLLDFEFRSQPFDLVDEIASKFPLCAVVAILNEAEMVNLDRVVLSGARAFVKYPYQPRKLVITIKRVMELLERNKLTPEEPSDTGEVYLNSKNTFTVFSPKGGAGTTTVATNLAITLHNTTKADVLLIDGKLAFGHVSLFLNLLTGNSVIDLIAHAGMLDQQLIKQVVVQHTSGIYVLPSPNSITEAQGIKPENLFTVIQGLQQMYPYVIIDGGNTLNENSVTYMDSSDKILLVFNPELASMRDVRQFMEVTTTLSYEKEKVLFLLNLTGRKADVRPEEIEKILNIKIFGSIPADEEFAISSLNEGVPMVVKKARHQISRAYSKITKALLENIQAFKAGKGNK